MRELGVWRSWLAHLVWDQRVLCSSHSTPTFNKNLLKISRFFLFRRGGHDIIDIMAHLQNPVFAIK